MSVEFTLHDCKLSLTQWDKLLEAWLEKKEIETYEDACFDGDEDSASAYLFAHGSIRGVQLTYQRGRVDVRLGALSSRRDWQYAYSLIRAAMRKGGGTFERETGETYARVELNRANAHAEAVKDFTASAEMLQAQFEQQDGEFDACFPTGTFNVPLRREDFDRFSPKKATALEKRLRNKVRDLAEAYHSSTLVLNGGVKLGTWALIPTIVGECDAVSVDYHHTTIRLDELKQLLASRAEDLGGGLTYLPELDRRADKKLLEAIREAGIEPDELISEAGAVSESAMELDRMVAIHDGAKLVMRNMFKGRDPQVATKKLIKQGEDPEFAESLVMVVARIMTGTVQDGRDAEDVLAELIEDGLPEGLVITTFEAIGEAIKEHEAAQEKPRKAKIVRAKKVPDKKKGLRSKAPKKKKRRF